MKGKSVHKVSTEGETFQKNNVDLYVHYIKKRQAGKVSLFFLISLIQNITGRLNSIFFVVFGVGMGVVICSIFFY